MPCTAQGSHQTEFVLEDPLPSDNIGLGWTGHKILGVVLEESTVFFHSCLPNRVSKSASEGLRHRREAQHGRRRAFRSRSLNCPWSAGWPPVEQEPRPWAAERLP